MQFLRQNTETIIEVGIFRDKTDKVTPISTLVLSDIYWKKLLKHNGEAVVDLATRTWSDVPGLPGKYYLTLFSSDVDTLGRLSIIFQDDWYLCPVELEFMVINPNYWDSKYGNYSLRVNSEHARSG